MGFVLFFDGACRGNPGPMGIGVVLIENGKRIKEISKSIGIGGNIGAVYLPHAPGNNQGQTGNMSLMQNGTRETEIGYLSCSTKSSNGR